MKRVFTVFCAMAFCFCSCEQINVSIDAPQTVVDDEEEDGDDESDPEGTGKDDLVDTDSGAEDDLDISEFTKTLDIVWTENGVVYENELGLQIDSDGGHVTIGTPTSEGVKLRLNLSGTCSDGSLKIYNGVKAEDTNKKLLLCLDGLELTSTKGPAINVQSGKTVYLYTSQGIENSLCDASSYSGIPDGEDAKSCLFSEKQIVFCGSGTLNITGKYKHAICVDDYICIKSGNLNVLSASSDGIHTNDYVRIEGGNVSINSSGEGIQCEELETGYFYMNGGSLKVRTSGSQSGAIETAYDVLIEGGELDLAVSGNASKCIKSDNNVAIKGGVLTLSTTGGGLYDSTEKDAKACACIKAENIVTLSGGEISCSSTGAGGKGINCYQFICEEGTILSVNTSGSTYSYSSSTCRPKAVKATDGVKINGGFLDLKTSGTEGEGLESKSWVEINGGQIIINAKDDGINAATTITFNGGYTYVYSLSNDGIDSNYGRTGAITVNDGVVISHAAGGAEEGFDADSHAYLSFNGGYVFSTGGQQGGGGGGGRPGRPGSGGTSSTSPVCSQTTCSWSSSVSTGWFTITDASGAVVMSCYIPRSLSSNNSLFSAPLAAGTTYKYGVLQTAPQGATEVFGSYYYSDGQASGLSSSFSASGTYSTL